MKSATPSSSTAGKRRTRRLSWVGCDQPWKDHRTQGPSRRTSASSGPSFSRVSGSGISEWATTGSPCVSRPGRSLQAADTLPSTVASTKKTRTALATRRQQAKPSDAGQPVRARENELEGARAKRSLMTCPCHRHMSISQYAICYIAPLGAGTQLLIHLKTICR